MAGGYGMQEPLFLLLILFLVLAWISCILRAYVKIAMIKRVSADDYLMLGGILFFTSYSAIGLYGITGGVGAPGPGMTPEAASRGLYAWWLCEVLYAPLTLLSRSSVAVFLLHIAVQRVHRAMIIGIVFAFWVVAIPLLMIAIFQCDPVSYFWKQPLPAAPQGTCMDSRIIFVAAVVHSVVTACSDWALGILAIAMLWKVQLNKRTKLTLSILLSMGIFAGIALIVRIIYVRPFHLSPDFLSETINVANWSVIEPGICIIAGCLATLRPLFSRCGWSGIANSSHRASTKYRKSRSKQDTDIVLSPRSGSGRGIYSIPSDRMTDLQPYRTVDSDLAHAFDEAIDLEKGEGMVGNKASKDIIGHDGSDVSTRSSDGNRRAATQASNHLRSPESHASVDSDLSIRFTSFSMSAPLQLGQRDHGLRLHRHSSCSHRRSGSSHPSPTDSPPTSILPKPPACQKIVVQTTTKVEYDDTSPPSAQTMPIISGNTVTAATNSTAVDELPKSMTFHGDHSIHISGRRVKH